MIGEPRQNILTKILPYIYGLPIPIYIGLVLGQFESGQELFDNIDNIKWINFPITSATGVMIYSCILIYLLIAITSIIPGNVRPGEEFGSEKWVSWKTLTDLAAPENREYKDALKPHVLKKRLISRKSPKCIPNMKVVTSTNRILSKHISIDTNVKTAKLNCNTAIVGSPGSRKTTSVIYTNIMQLGGSMCICDPKGESTEKCAPLAEYAGVDVKILDLFNPEKSLRFNPFEYVTEPDDIISMVSFMFRGFDANKDGKSNDPFWDDANMLEFAAVCYLLWYDARKEDQTLPMALKLVNLNSTEVVIPVTGKDGKINNVKKTGLQLLFENYAKRNPGENLPMTYYQMFRKAKDKTLSNIETTLAAKTQLLLQPKMERFFSKDELKLHELGEKRQILFLKVPDADERYYFIVSMVYMFLYKALYYVSDVKNNTNGCPVPVTILEDEFTMFPQPDNFLAILGREYNTAC